MSGGQAAGNRSGQQSGKIFQKTKRHAPFSSARPPFVSPDEYHQFSTADNRRTAGEEAAEVIVIRTPLKRKPGQDDNEAAESSERATSPEYAEAVTSPLLTPVSEKGGRACGRSKATKCNKSGLWTPISNASSPSNNLTPTGSCRYDSSLGLLTRKFISLLKHAQGGILDLNNAAETLEVQKRRIYDITNVLEGIGLIEKKLKNRIRWKGLDDLMPGGADISNLQVEVERLTLKEQSLNEHISKLREKLRHLSEDGNNQKWLYVTGDDIKGIPCFQNETLIAIKAPHGTTLEVLDPDEASDYPQRRYRIVLRSTMGPIDVYLVSKFEEQFEMRGVETPPRPPPASSSGSIQNSAGTMVEEVTTVNETGLGAQNTRMCPDLDASDDFVGGMTKIVPSDGDTVADYWLLSDAEVSITDMWKTTPEVQWDGLNKINPEDFITVPVSTTVPQTPPPGVIEVQSTGQTLLGDECKHYETKRRRSSF